MIDPYPLFLPNVVTTSTDSQNRLSDERIRYDEARQALFHTIREERFSSVVIVDGSDCKLLTREEIDTIQESGIEVEQLAFQQDREQVRRFGKSNGEMQITEHMLRHSRLVNRAGGFVKLSPRYRVMNLDPIMDQVCDKESAFFYFHPPIIRRSRRFVCTGFYKMSLDTYAKYFTDCRLECDVDVEGYLESVFFRRLATAPSKPFSAPFPEFAGIGGTLGTPLKNRYRVARGILSRAGLLARYV